MEKLKEQLTITEIRKNLELEHNWEQQEKHYQAQQKHWKWITVIAVIAIVANAFAKVWIG